MTTYSPGYGRGSYGIRLYGYDGSIIDAAAAASVAVSVSADAQHIKLASATAVCEITSLVSCRRVRLGSALSSISCIVSATAIKKWEPGSDTAETWTPQSDTNEAWTPVSDTAETWIEAA